MTSPRYALLIPVKDGRSVKSRLGVGGEARRAALMTAFAQDAITAALACADVDVYVIGDHVELAGPVAGLVPEKIQGKGVTVLPDQGEGDLNRALRSAADLVTTPDAGTAVLLADLPCLRTADLESALAQADGRCFVPDAAGTGTTLLIAPPGHDLDPSFGVGSAKAHADSGAREIGSELLSLRLDVDTTTDLAAALRFGVGPATADATADLA